MQLKCQTEANNILIRIGLFKNDYQKRMMAENHLLLEKRQKAMLLLDEVDEWEKRNMVEIYLYARALSLSWNRWCNISQVF